jgi:hypothetical protein
MGDFVLIIGFTEEEKNNSISFEDLSNNIITSMTARPIRLSAILVLIDKLYHVKSY